MTREDRPGRIVELAVGDDGDAWQEAGFAVVDGATDVGGITLRFLGAHGDRGIRGWRLDGVDTDIDGLATIDAGSPAPAGAHDNAVTTIDHVVAGSPDLDRTTAALTEHSIELRRTRDFEREGVGRQQRFFWLGPVILELIGRAEPKPDADGPATFWGLAFTVADIDETCRVLGERTSSHRTAIQPGRRISTLRSAELDISIPVAFMTPHPGAGG